MLAHDTAQCLGFQRVFGEVAPGKLDGAAVGPCLTGQDTYGRCLSGSVRSEIGHKFPIPHMQAYAGQDAGSAKRFCDMFSLNHQSGACRWGYWEEMRA